MIVVLSGLFIIRKIRTKKDTKMMQEVSTAGSPRSDDGLEAQNDDGLQAQNDDMEMI